MISHPSKKGQLMANVTRGEGFPIHGRKRGSDNRPACGGRDNGEPWNVTKELINCGKPVCKALAALEAAAVLKAVKPSRSPFEVPAKELVVAAAAAAPAQLPAHDPERAKAIDEVFAEIARDQLQTYEIALSRGDQTITCEVQAMSYDQAETIALESLKVSIARQAVVR